MVTVQNHISIALTFRNLDVHFVILFDEEITAEGLPAAIRIAVGSEIDRHRTGVGFIDHIVCSGSIRIMAFAREPFDDLSIRRSSNLDLVSNRQIRVEVVLSGNLRILITRGCLRCAATGKCRPGCFSCATGCLP